MPSIRTGLLVAAALFALAAHSQAVEARPSPAWLLDQKDAVAQALLPDGRSLEVGCSGVSISAGTKGPAGSTKLLSIANPCRIGATATVLPNGKVLIWGGIDRAGNILTDGQLFDPANNQLGSAGAVALLPRAGHSATVLTDGRLLVAGGWNAGLGELTESELWDFRTNRNELLAADLTPPRGGHRATLLADGRVLIVGGLDPHSRQFRDAALFDPTKIRFVDVSDAAAAQLSEADGKTPSVSASVPADHAVDFPYDGLIALRFSALLNVTSLQTDSVTLIGPTGVTPIRVVPAEGGRLLFVQPNSDLSPGTSYSLFIDGARQRDGTALPFTVIAFTTASMKAGESSSGVSTDGGSSLDPSGSVDAPPGNSGSESKDSASAGTDFGDPALAANGTTRAARRVTTGSAQALAQFEASCTNQQSIHGHRLCRDRGTVADGIFIPGHDNINAHWRVGLPAPPLPAGRDIAASKAADGAMVYGTILRIDDKPLAGVTVSLGLLSTRTDSSGRFVLHGVPAGAQVLLIDGSSANRNDEEYGEFNVAVSLKEKRVNAVPFNIYVPRITARDKFAISSPTTEETIISHPAIPGLELRIPAGTVLRDRRGHILTQLALVPMPADRSPVPLPTNFPVYFSIQPSTAVVQAVSADAAKGIRIVYPNYIDFAEGHQHAFWLYDPERSGWMVYADGHLTDSQAQALPNGDLGVNIVMPGGYSVGGPNPPLPNPPAPPAPPPAACNSGCCTAGDGGGDGGGSGGGGPSGDGPQLAGDPVDCYSGLFLHQYTDLGIRDILPIAVTRTYRPNWNVTLPFGRGMSHNYGMYLYNPSGSKAPGEIDLILPTGAAVAFKVVSGNLDNGGPGLWVSNSLPEEFLGAQLTNVESILGAPCNAPGVPPYEGNLWPCDINMTLKDGTVYHFPNDGGGSFPPSYPTSIMDRFGNKITLNYVSGQLQSVQAPTSGRILTYCYNGTLVSKVTDTADTTCATGRVINYSYTGDLLTKVTYPDATTEIYAYDANGRMTSVTDRRGNVRVVNQYDSIGRVSKQTLSDGAIYTWDYTGGYTKVTDPRGNVRRMSFDAGGYPLVVTKAFGAALAQTTTFIRSPSEQVTLKTDPMGRQTRYVYDGNGNMLQRTSLYGTADAVSEFFTYTSDGFNLLASATDPLNHTTTYSYNANGCLTSVTDALAHVTNIVCNSSGQPVAVTDANGNSTVYGYYNGHDLHTVTNALGNTTTYTTDSHLGLVTAVQDAAGDTYQTVYDINDRPFEQFDSFNKQTTLLYDGNGNLVSVADPNGGTTQYGYDVRNRRTSRTDALSQVERWTYDGVGNQITYTDRKQQVTQYQYDALNRVSLVTYADNGTVTPTFDTGNRLTQVVDTVSGTITRGYDGLDRLTQEQTPQGVVNYTYDAAGRRSTMTPASQAQVVYTFDPADRLTNIVQDSQSVTLGYDAGNRRTSVLLPNGTSMTYAYDSANEITAINYKAVNGAILTTRAYSYDNVGRRTATTGGFIGNPLPDSVLGGTFDLNNRQTVWNGFTVNYNADGDPTVAGALYSFAFDARHRLTQISGLASASFAYDTFGRRISKTANGTTTSYLYDGSNAVQEVQGTTISAILTGLGIDERFARDEPAGKRYFMTDALGSTLALTDSNGTVQQMYAYGPYGEVAASGSSNNPYQYTGRENDNVAIGPAGSLYYYRARYYSPTMKRFISEDPMGLAEGLNEYAYAYGRPLDINDPQGLGLRDKFYFFLCIIANACNPPNLPPPPAPTPTTTQPSPEPWNPTGQDEWPDWGRRPNTCPTTEQGPPPRLPPRPTMPTANPPPPWAPWAFFVWAMTYSKGAY